jgi:hypothetical protein
MAKHAIKAEMPAQDEIDPPETFEEALAFALRALADAAPGIPPEWLAALNREKDSSSR